MSSLRRMVYGFVKERQHYKFKTGRDFLRRMLRPSDIPWNSDSDDLSWLELRFAFPGRKSYWVRGRNCLADKSTRNFWPSSISKSTRTRSLPDKRQSKIAL